MTNDLLKQAREYLEKTEGITDGEWDGIFWIGNIEVKPNISSLKRRATEAECKAMGLTPIARALIKELVGMIEKSENVNDEFLHILVFNELTKDLPLKQMDVSFSSVLFNMTEKMVTQQKENQALKQRAKVAENKLRRLICYNDIEKIENENKALKQRITGLEGKG